MEIVFLTLFLGLVAGPTRVELSAPSSTAAVELLLDGARVARLGAPPWRGSVDLGAELLPHHLVARALDGAGRELASADQWLNLPRPPAEVQIVTEGAAADGSRRVRLVSQTITGEPPAAVRLTLDGKPLAPDAQGRVLLPPPRPGGATRVLSAELRWAGGVEAHREVALGREYGDEVSTELTAVPVWTRGKGELPAAAQVGGWLTADGKSLQVDAIESESLQQLLVVRDPAAPPRLATLGAARQPLEKTLVLGHAELQFLWPEPHEVPGGKGGAGGGAAAALFDLSQAHDATEHGLVWLLARVDHDVHGARRPRLADAVATACLRAYAGGRQRAVILVLAPAGAADGSEYSPAVVRRYCAALRVPLLVWSAGALDPASVAAWGGVEDITLFGRLWQAFKTLRKDLDTQRILMVEGQPLPQSVTLGGGAEAAAAIALEPGH